MMGENCYLCFTGLAENGLYLTWVIRCKECTDGLHIENCELCYELTGSKNCYNVNFSEEAYDCRDSTFLFDCHGCHDCFGGANLRNAAYVFWGEQLNQKTYEEKIKTVHLGNHEELQKYKKLFATIKKQAIYKNLENNKSVDCYRSEYLDGCKNCRDCRELINCENINFCDNGLELKDTVDTSYFGVKSQLGYELLGGGTGSYNTKFCDTVRSSNNLEYCSFCQSCTDCFGCSGLQNKKYCILNKQYSEDEYFSLVKKIKDHALKTGEYGEFFPLNMSFFPYNDTMAAISFPKTKTEVETLDGYWQEQEKNKIYTNAIAAKDLPNNIKDVGDDILSKTIICETTGNGFKIIKEELAFYRAHNIALPRIHPEVRYQQRLGKRRNGEIALRNCDKCGKEMESSIKLNNGLRVYCEQCYQKSIY
jgi:hypothetical protein